MSNYEKVFAYFQEQFRKLDLEEVAGRLGLMLTDETLEVPWFQDICQICRETGEMRLGEKEMEVHDRLIIMHHLCFSKPGALHSEKWIPFRDVKEAACFELAYVRSAIQPMVERFSGKTEELRRACEVLGGSPMKYGDVSYRIPIFPNISLIYIFYDQDEEFPASLNILFESTITSWTHPESVPVLAEETSARLLAIAEKDCQVD